MLLLTTKELGALLGVSARTLGTWKRRGMPCHQTGLTVRFDQVQVLRWVREQGAAEAPAKAGAKFAKGQAQEDERAAALAAELEGRQ